MTLLVVDDQPELRSVLCAALRSRGHTTLEAQDGVDALERLRAGTVDGIVSDVLMPRMDGYRLCAEVRRSERWAHLPFVFYSGAYSSSQDEQTALARGGDGFLPKSAGVDELIAAVVKAQGNTGRRRVESSDDAGVLREYSERLVNQLKATSRELDAANRELRESRARYEGIIDTAMDAIITLDDQQRIVLFNGEAEERFGLKSEAVIGQPLDRLLPERFRGRPAAMIEASLGSRAAPRRIGALGQMSGLRSDGQEFPFEASISRIELSGQSFVTIILRDITERLRAEETARRAAEQLRAFASRLQSVREQERSAVAREIHDVLAQELTRLKIDLVWLSKRLSHPVDETLRPSLVRRVTDATSQTDTAITTVQRIATALRPVILDSLGLTAAVEWLTEDFARRVGIPCRVQVPPGDVTLDRDRATAVFRILQESLTNVARHAHASEVDVTLAMENDHVTLSVRDNGQGTSAAQIANPYSIGLVGMRERAEAYDGTLEIQSAPGAGLTVTLRLPLPAAGESESSAVT